MKLGLREGETVKLIESGDTGELAFGPKGVWIEYDEKKELPKNVEFILKLRGVLNENMEGAGI